MLREMSYSSLPQDESSAAERSSFMTHGLIEYPHRSSSGSNQKIICFVVSFLLVTGATLAIVIPLMLDGPKTSSKDKEDGSLPTSSPVKSGGLISDISDMIGKITGGSSNETFTYSASNTSDPQPQSDVTMHVEEGKEETVNPNDDGSHDGKTWKVVHQGDHIYIVPVYNGTQTNITQFNNTQTTISNDYKTPDEGGYELSNNMTIVSNSSVTNNTNINGKFVVNGTESSNTTGQAELNVTVAIVPTTKPDLIVTNAVQLDVTVNVPQESNANTSDVVNTDNIVPQQPLDHSGSPWEQYTNATIANKATVISSLDNMTLIVLVALIVVSLSTLVGAVAFLIHVKIETRRRRRNIANVINDLQSPDKIILLNSDESENSEESEDEYQRN